MKLKFALMFLLGLVLSGCMSAQDRLYYKLSKEDRGNNKYQGHYKIGKTYEIKGNSYSPKKQTSYDEVGLASWYGSKGGFHGKKTANGDKYNKHMLTAAHKTLPLPSVVKITNLHNNKSLIVMVNDRGPFHKNRLIDVSEEAAKLLSFKNQGVAKVRVQYLEHETKELMYAFSINGKEGARAKRKVKTPKCSVGCHIKLLNIKHNFLAAK